MRNLVLILIVYLAVQSLQAQESIWPDNIQLAFALSPDDSVMLCSLPVLDRFPVLKSSDLPYFLDNSALPYYRPIYEQVAAECSQVSAIGYNFTYEINRLRDLPSDDSANQYPPHFMFNFSHDGTGWWGVSYFNSFEILKTLGCPTVETYGGMSAGGNHRWMSGYDDYLSAMSNRISEAYQIKVGTIEGLMTLKHWLHNHLDGSEIGGVASFYSNAPWNMHPLPEGTPEGGKQVIPYWGGIPAHAMTITGYNDSIRWDYNEDGQYTNHLDINDDGVVDLRDWEIGGLIFADGWDGGINFGDSGKCYMMYKTLADEVWEGGIWDNAVHVVDVKSIEKPKLTAKIKLNHDMRGMLRIRCGVSSNTNDTLPEYSIGFPVFNFQGGNHYMQGGTDLEENKNIEFGLDITPLLGLFDDNNFKQFYLMVEERDLESLGSGYIESFSVIDYTGSEPVEYYCAENNIPIANNSTSYASLLFSDELDIMRVTTDELPHAIVGEPYSYQLTTQGETAPLKWSLQLAVQEKEIQAEFETDGLFVEPESYDYGFYECVLPFSFPFYGKEYDTIYISSKGFVMFEKTNYQWPYLRDPALMIKHTKCIAPLLCQYLKIRPIFGQGIWTKDHGDKFSISWIAFADHSSYYPHVEFAVEIYKDGRISFVYADDFNGYLLPWSCGISKGDQLNYYIPQIAEEPYILPGDAIEIECIPLPVEMAISEDGNFYGTPLDNYNDVDIVFCAEDDDHIRAFKTLKFFATGLGIDDDPGQEISDLLTYPNPFRQEVTIQFINDIPGPIRCVVYSSSGQMIKQLFDGSDMQDGELIYWDGTDHSGNSCPPGLYFLNVHTERQSLVKKLIFSGS